MKIPNTFLLFVFLFLQSLHNSLVASEEQNNVAYNKNDYIIFYDSATQKTYQYVPFAHSVSLKKSNNLEGIKKLLTMPGINPNTESVNGKTSLHYACELGQIKRAESLLNLDTTNPNKKTTTEGLTPLFIACKEGNTALVKLLLTKKKTDVSISNKNGITPIQYVYDNYTTINDADCIMQLLKSSNAKLDMVRSIRSAGSKAMTISASMLIPSATYAVAMPLVVTSTLVLFNLYNSPSTSISIEGARWCRMIKDICTDRRLMELAVISGGLMGIGSLLLPNVLTNRKN